MNAVAGRIALEILADDERADVRPSRARDRAPRTRARRSPGRSARRAAASSRRPGAARAARAGRAGTPVPGSTIATGPFVSIPSPAATYIRTRNSRRRSGKRSLSAKNTSVSDMKAVIQMSMKMRRREHQQPRQRREADRGEQRRRRVRRRRKLVRGLSGRAPDAARNDHHGARARSSSAATPTDTPNAW